MRQKGLSMRKLFNRFISLFLHKCHYCGATELDSTIYIVPFKTEVEHTACMSCIIDQSRKER
mgnify:CR=1 FL=1